MTEAPLPSASSPSTPNPATEFSWFVGVSNTIVRGAVFLGTLRCLRGLATAWDARGLGVPSVLAAVADAGVEFVGFGILGLVVAAVVRALGAWSAPSNRGGHDGGLSAEGLIRALSRPSAGEPGGAVEDAPAVEASARLAEIRRLLRDGAWSEAREAVDAFRSDFPSDPRGAAASDELNGARLAALSRLEAELEAAKSVNDPEQAMEIHSRMQFLVDDQGKDEREAELARWFLLIVHRRLRGGRIQQDVVGLADRVADRFGHTKEGASLRAALPTLRRSAGLCPRCGKPFTGAADACPECLGASSSSASAAFAAAVEDDEPPPAPREPDWFTEPFDESAA